MPQFDFDHLLKPDFMPTSEEDWELLRAATATLFKPKTPVDDEKLFNGRIKQINAILDAVYEDGGHAIIFGERGVGKTSLSRIIEKKVAGIIPNLRVVPVSCSKADDFYTMWGNAFNDFNVDGEDAASVFRRAANPYRVYNALDDLEKDKYHIYIFDEFDRIEDDASLSAMADMMKHFSNHPLNVTIIVVGVGDTLLDLFGSHESIARCCSQIKMPRMSEAELDEILDERLRRINFTIDAAVRRKTRKLSQGLPGYVHLLGQLMLKNAIMRRSTHIDDPDFQEALNEALDKADYSARQDYLSAVKSPRKDNKYREVLLACALAESDEMGHFYAGDVREPYSRVRGRQMEITNFSTNLSNLCDEDRGPALIKSGERKRYQYRFANPL
ncbi:AAA family ATPase, partial [Xanthobacter autotrophicus]|uniref:AAA family ATPase n=1 Tax=Xanthobacter autotrophicus TaxID=280 RepID=UPI00372B7059